MPPRLSPRDANVRNLITHTRGIASKIDDSKKMQEIDSGGFADEKRKGVERFQNYGITSVPVGPRKQKKPTGGGAGAGGTGGGAEQKQGGESAEVLAMHLGGQRGHQVIVAIDDRRNRIYGLKPGETAQYDDQQQKVHIKRDGVEIRTHKKAGINIVSDENQGADDAEREQKKREEKESSLSSVIAEPTVVTINRGKCTIILTDTKVICQWKDDSVSMLVNEKHVHIRYKGNRIWVNEEGCFATKPIVVMDDPNDAG